MNQSSCFQITLWIYQMLLGQCKILCGERIGSIWFERYVQTDLG